MLQPLAEILEDGLASVGRHNLCQVPGGDDVKDVSLPALGQVHIALAGVSVKDIAVSVRRDDCDFVKLGEVVWQVADGDSVYLEAVAVGVERGVVEDDIPVVNNLLLICIFVVK